MTMTTESIQRALDQYHSEGLSFFPIPARSKEAAAPWKVYQERQPTEDEIAHWKSNGTASIAIVCGTVSGNLVVPDFDDHETWYRYLDYTKASLKLDLFTFTRLVRTSRGIHVYVRLPQTIKSQKFPKIDLKAEGGYVIAWPSIHPSGTPYEIINPDVPIRTIDNLADIGIYTNHKPEENKTSGNQPGWVSSLLQGVKQGERDDSAKRLIGYFRNNLPADVTERIMLEWNKKNQPPLEESVILEKISRFYSKYQERKNTGYNNSIIFNATDTTSNDSKTFQNRDKTVTDSFHSSDNIKKANYSASFDSVLKDAGKMSRRDIALSIGLQPTSDAFRQIVKRRLDETKIRPWQGRHDILEWINKDYKVLTLADYKKQTNLSIALPLGLNKYVNVPAGSVIGVAGYTSAGKTAFLLEVCDLNVCTQNMPVYYWFNEMSEDRMLLRLEDYPNLINELGKQFKAVKQTDFEFYDVIDPDGINVIDYLDLDGEGDNQQVYMIGAVIKKLQRKTGKGIDIFALQKQKGKDMGYGGVYSAKLSNLYLSLDVVSQGETSMMGKCKIVKAKDWGELNPVGLFCNYYTGGKHGRIMSDNKWMRGPNE